jgi:hypothetical protein
MNLTAQSRTGTKNRRESRRALAVSIILHVVIGIALIRVLLMPNGLGTWLHISKASKPQVEHLQYVALPPAPPPPASAPSVPPPAHPAPPPSGPKIVTAPTVVPTNVPAAPTKPAPSPEVEGVGPVAATGGPGSGARIEYHDGHIWVPAAPPGTGERPRSIASQLDSAAHAMTGHYNDSVMALGPQHQPGDWTKTIGGKKWGVDPQYIHLGPVSIPTAILAALPLNNFTGNPIDAANERAINYRSADIAFQRNKAEDDEEFNKAVKDERLRKEREHEQQQQQQKKETPPPSSTPTVAQQQGGSSPPTQ